MPVHCFVDIGSNSVRGLLVEADEGGLRLLDDITHITKLGQGLATAPEQSVPQSATLLPEAVEATVFAVKEIAERARLLGAQSLHAVATWALRPAEGGAVDANLFLCRLEEEAGVTARVLSAEEECRLGFAGASARLSLARGQCLVMDIGGGTLNLTWGMPSVGSEPAKVSGWVSLPLGARAMSQGFFHHDPPLDKEVEALSGWVKDTLRPHLGGGAGGLRAVGCGGVFTTLGALRQRLRRSGAQIEGGVPGAKSTEANVYDRNLVHGLVFGVEDLASLSEALVGMPLAQRARLPGVGRERADIVPAGAVVARQAALLLGVREVVVSDDGMLWGLVLATLQEGQAP